MVGTCLAAGHPALFNKIASWTSPHNWARNLHRLIQSWGLTLMVVPTTVMTPCKFRSSVTMTPWPVLMLSSWLRLIFDRTNGEMLCNGLPLGLEWKHELLAFWNLYQTVKPDHEVYKQPQDRLGWTLPFLYHGDEGRGKLRRAVLICSYQPVLQSRGHSFKSRLLTSIFPGERYACVDEEETLEALHGAVSEDLKDLFQNGIKVGVCLCVCVCTILHNECPCDAMCVDLDACFLVAGYPARWFLPADLGCILWGQGRLAMAPCFRCNWNMSAGLLRRGVTQPLLMQI